MVIIIVGVLAYAVSMLMATGTKGYVVTGSRNEALEQARVAMDRMTREIRNLRSRTDIGTASATQICFVSMDGSRISFRFPGSSATAIAREEPPACPGAGGNTLATSISALTFDYLQADGSADPAPPTNTKRIRISLTATVSGESLQLRSEVWPRAL